MFKNSKSKKVIVSTILLLLVLTSAVFAASNIYNKQLTATIGRIKFQVDGKDVTQQIESKYNAPAFTVKEFDSRSYVPVRAIGDLFGIEIEYDNKTHTAIMTDAKSKAYEKEIAELKKELQKYKKEEEKKEEKKSDIKEIEKKLNKDYGTYEEVDFDIKLKEGKSRIDVEINMDTRDFRQEVAWNRMGQNNKKRMIEDIVNIITKEFTDVDVYGSIYDSYVKGNVATFDKKVNKNLSISYDNRPGSNSGNKDRYYLEDIIKDEFGDRKIDRVSMTNFNSSTSTIKFDINFFDDEYNRREWHRLTDGDIKAMLDVISAEAEYYYDDYYYDQGYRNRYEDAQIKIFKGITQVGYYEKTFGNRNSSFTRHNK